MTAEGVTGNPKYGTLISSVLLIVGAFLAGLGHLVSILEARAYPSIRCQFSAIGNPVPPDFIHETRWADTPLPLRGEICLYELATGESFVTFSSWTSTGVVAIGSALVAIGLALLAFKHSRSQ